MYRLPVLGILAESMDDFAAQYTWNQDCISIFPMNGALCGSKRASEPVAPVTIAEGIIYGSVEALGHKI